MCLFDKYGRSVCTVWHTVTVAWVDGADFRVVDEITRNILLLSVL